jgi:hypothetical protein
MFLRAWLSSWLLTPICCAALLGCAVVDQYSGRAIVYNLEAEQAQDQGLLLNIVRAYLRRPMQFTTVSTITGVASASAGAQYTLPMNVPFRPPTQGATGIAAFPPLPTWLFSGSMSGGPAFTVPVLDTQEFYQGILKAIPGQIWDLYIQANYPPDLLFNLFVEKVVMQRIDQDCKPKNHLAGCEFVFQNYVLRDVQIDLFQALADYLLVLGMTTERPKPDTVPFDDSRTTNVNVRYIGTLSPDGNAQVLAPPGGSAASDVQPASKPYKFCFTPRTYQDSQCVAEQSLCGGGNGGPDKELVAIDEQPHTCSEPHPRGGAPANTAQQAFKTNPTRAEGEIQTAGSATVGIIPSAEFITRLIRIVQNEAPGTTLANELSAFQYKPVTIKIYLRHTEGMIYYLGEIARRALHPELDMQPRAIFAKEDVPYELHPEKRCALSVDGCGFIFQLHEGEASVSRDFLTINYDGRWFSIPRPDQSQLDLSTLTFDILKQLVALNSSAKSLPQSSVITAVGGQ